jgi:uncharacterized protein (TIGR02246 family)
VQDRLDLMDLVARYAECIDSGDAECYAGLFTPDGVLETRSGTAHGRAEIKAWLQGLFDENRAGTQSRLKHFLGLPIIRGDGDRATVRTYVTIPKHLDSGEIMINMAGTYLDDCVKLNGEWLFARRVISIEFVAS